MTKVDKLTSIMEAALAPLRADIADLSRLEALAHALRDDVNELKRTQQTKPDWWPPLVPPADGDRSLEPQTSVDGKTFRFADVKALTSYSRSTINRKIRRKAFPFPEPFQVEGRNCWEARLVLAWWTAEKARNGDGAPRIRRGTHTLLSGKP